MDNSWYLKKEGHKSSDRSERRINLRLTSEFKRFIKDKAWWDSLELNQKVEFMYRIRTNNETELDIKKKFPNYKNKRNILVDLLINDE